MHGRTQTEREFGQFVDREPADYGLAASTKHQFQELLASAKTAVAQAKAASAVLTPMIYSFTMWFWIIVGAAVVAVALIADHFYQEQRWRIMVSKLRRRD